MRVLVIDDNPIHQMSARQTLVGHNLTIVGTYDEARELLQEPHASWEAVQEELNRRGYGEDYRKDLTDEKRLALRKERAQIEQELCPPSFDAVLSDLLIPASSQTMGPKGMKYVGQEMPVGFALSLMAAIHGAKYVAVVTDTNHHDHPASAMLDPFVSRCPHEHDTEGTPPRLTINGAKTGYYQSESTLIEGTTCPDCNGTGNKEACCCIESNAGSPKPDCDNCKGTGHSCWACRNSGKRWGKNWGAVLSHLTSSK